jgi:hypothetical protein
MEESFECEFMCLLQVECIATLCWELMVIEPRVLAAVVVYMYGGDDVERHQIEHQVDNRRKRFDGR